MHLGFTNGAFDLLHEGHRHFFRECMLNCDNLIVALNTDESIRTAKGPERPIQNLSLRAGQLLEILRPVDDLICAFDSEDDLRRLILRHSPSVYFQGEDHYGKHLPQAEGTRVHYVARHPRCSTTQEIERNA